MDAQRAYSLMEVKAVNADRRTFSGIASTPTMDRVRDRLDSKGATFKNPIILLRMHSHSEPVGRANLGKPTAKGIPFDAEIPIVENPGLFKDRTDLAWDEVNTGVVRAVSIGFRPIKWSFNDEGGVDYQEFEIYELSTVSVPALPEAIITSVKSMGGPLPEDVVRLIRAADRGGAVKLIAPSLNTGAVRLTK